MHKIIRVGIYWFPPEPLKSIIENTWQGDYQEKACQLISRHSGECPIWKGHATLLDSLTILEESKDLFLKTMADILKKWLPIPLGSRVITKWGKNVFLRWADKTAMDKAQKMRKELMEKALEFVIMEPVSWEAINDLERTMSSMGLIVDTDFRKGVERLKAILREERRSPLLIHAPNIALDWYVKDKLANGKELEDGKLPFGDSIHVSLATSVREDTKLGISAKEVGDTIMAELGTVPAWAAELAPGRLDTLDSAFLVEPYSPSEELPMQVTVVDHISGLPRNEWRQEWHPTWRLFQRCEEIV